MSEQAQADEKQPKKMGRPSIKTPELAQEFCRRIASGRSVANVCKDDDMPSDFTIWKWLYEDEDFSSLYARAIQARAMVHADTIDDLSEKVAQGQMPPDAARVAIDAKKWVASRLLPRVYGDKQIVEANVTHTHQLHLDALRALSSRRSGNEVGYIEGQAIEISSDPTFSGERQDAPMQAIEAGLVVDAADPPVPHPHGGAALASATSPDTEKKPSDPPPPTPRKARKPRAAKNKK